MSYRAFRDLSCPVYNVLPRCASTRNCLTEPFEFVFPIEKCLAEWINQLSHYKNVLPNGNVVLPNGLCITESIEVYPASLGKDILFKQIYKDKCNIQKIRERFILAAYRAYRRNISKSYLSSSSLCKRKNKSLESINTKHFLYLSIISVIEL